MPTIPRYYAEEKLKVAMIDVSKAGAPGRALAEIGEEMGEYLEQQQTAARNQKLLDAKLGVTRELVDLEAAFDTDTDWETMHSRYEQKAGDIERRYFEQLGDDPELQTSFRQEIEPLRLSGGLTVRRLAGRRQTDAFRATMDGSLADLAIRIPAARSPVEREFLERQAGEIVGRGLGSGLIGREEGTKALRGFRSTLAKNEATRLMLDDPAQAAGLLEDRANFSNLQENDRLDLIDRARGRVDALAREAEAETEKRQREAKEGAESERQAWLSDFTIKLARGEAGYADIEDSYHTGRIEPAERTRFTLALDERNEGLRKREAEIGRVALAIDGSGMALDHRSDADRDAVDAHYALASAQWDEVPPDQVPERIAGYVERVGIVPDTVKGQIRGWLRSGTPERKLAAADLIGRIERTRPAALADFAAEDIALGEMISGNLRAGVEPAAAVALAEKALAVPDAERQVRAERLAKGKTAEDNAKWLGSAATGGWLSSLPGGVPDALHGEFDAIYRQRYVATGDDDVSRRLALRDLKRTWSVTNIDGTPRWMKYAPEAVYAVPGADDGWMREQLHAEFRANSLLDPERPLEGRLLIVAVDRTARETLPSYGLVLLDKDGAFQPVLDKDGRPVRWRPDWKSSAAYERHAQELRDKVEGARRVRGRVIELQTEEAN